VPVEFLERPAVQPAMTVGGQTEGAELVQISDLGTGRIFRRETHVKKKSQVGAVR
jgi:hypothetical protein